MFTKRVYADEGIQACIIAAAMAFHTKLNGKMVEYIERLKTDPTLFATERTIQQEISV